MFHNQKSCEKAHYEFCCVVFKNEFEWKFDDCDLLLKKLLWRFMPDGMVIFSDLEGVTHIWFIEHVLTNRIDAAKKILYENLLWFFDDYLPFVQAQTVVIDVNAHVIYNKGVIDFMADRILPHHATLLSPI